MVVTKTDEKKEYACTEFLKWFTQAENNIEFGCSSGYLPVKKAANDKAELDKIIEERGLEVPEKTYDTLVAAFDTVKSSTMYTNKAFQGGTAARKVLEYNLSDKAVADRAVVEEKLAAGLILTRQYRSLSLMRLLKNGLQVCRVSCRKQ